MPPLRLPTDADLDAFERICARLSGFDNRLSFEWVDGWLTGLACAPPTAQPADWLTRMAGDAFDRAFADPADRAEGLKVLNDRLAMVRQQLDPERLDDEPDAMWLSPLLAQWTDEDRQAIVATGEVSAEDAAQLQTGALWAEAFGEGFSVALAEWDGAAGVADDAEAKDALRELIDHLGALKLAPADERFVAHVARYYPDQPPPDRDALIDAACFAVQDLRLWFVDHSPRTEPRRVAPTPGRNDPCPCGSGRKFKKCCGALD
jgi:uncharacterized protein